MFRSFVCSPLKVKRSDAGRINSTLQCGRNACFVTEAKEADLKITNFHDQIQVLLNKNSTRIVQYFYWCPFTKYILLFLRVLSITSQLPTHFYHFLLFQILLSKQQRILPLISFFQFYIYIHSFIECTSRQQESSYQISITFQVS